MEQVIEFYTHYDEENRLVRKQTEYQVTINILNNYVKSKSKLLDIASGTGVYALYYAKRNCRVEALDITPKNISILQRKINSPYLQINGRVHDSRNLEVFPGNSFDIVLNMGPVYHLDHNDLNTCIDECIRVLKPGGVLATSYVNKYSNYEKDKYFKYFKFHSYSEIENLLENPNLKKELHEPVDGKVYEKFNKMREEYILTSDECQVWLEDNPINFNPDVDGGNYFHGLYVARKK
jgi:ubiquinone/menaquinone biosynthesis C-methylase UbiE